MPSTGQATMKLSMQNLYCISYISFHDGLSITFIKHLFTTSKQKKIYKKHERLLKTKVYKRPEVR